MIPPVQPVIKKIFRQQQQEPVREDIGNGDPVMPIAEIKDQKIRGPEQKIDTPIQQHQVNVGEGIFPGVGLVPPGSMGKISRRLQTANVGPSATGPVVRFGLTSILHMAAMSVVGQQHFQADDDSVQRGRDQQ